MAINLRQRAEQDLGKTLEGEFSLPVVLIGPDGITYDTSENTGDPLTGQIIYDTLIDNPQNISGEQIVVSKPVVSLRRSSLARVPLAGEKWIVQIPVDPTAGAPVGNFQFNPTRPPEGGRTLGFIRLYLTRLVQKP
jgi:hypothetical protein